MRIHRCPRRDLFSPHDSQGGPKLSDISKRRESIVCSTDGGERRIVDRWDDKETSKDLPQEWTGSTKFRKSWGVLSEQTKPSAEGDLLHDVEGDILDLRPTSQQGKEWNLRNRKDQLEILWLIRKKCPRLVIGCGECILFCTVLYHEQIRRGAWFLHDLSGDASQLSLPCIIRLECRHDVFHALGDARDRRDGGRVSFLTNSPHIARRVEGSKSRENLDSEICEGLRQQVDDAGHTSAMMHLPSGTQARPVDLTPHILKKRSRRSEGGQIVQELNSIREGKYWDDAKGGWLDPVLVRKAREEEMQYVKKHVVYEKVPISQCWKETGKNPIKTGWADTNKGTSECPNIRSRWVARSTTLDPGPTCSAQRHLWRE